MSSDVQINVLAASEANIYMFLFALFQVAAVSGNKGLAELITNFTDKDIGKLGRFFSLSLSYGHIGWIVCIG